MLGFLKWDQLYERCAPLVYRRALGLVRQESDAWDITQEVFRKILESPPTLRARTRPMTYLYQMTTNVCLNYLRSQKARQPASEALEGDEVAVEGGAAAEARNILVALSDQLSERALRVAALHFMDHLTQEEISSVVGLSRKTVGRELEAIRTLAHKLAGSAEGGAS